MASWLFSSLRLIATAAVGALAVLGLASIGGFYAVMFGVVSIEQVGEAVAAARDWHLYAIGTPGGAALAYLGWAWRAYRAGESAQVIADLQTKLDSLLSELGSSPVSRRGNR